jgi:hypothetical protein
VLESAVDALEFKLNQVFANPESTSIEGRRRAVDAVLQVIAHAPVMAGAEGAIKQELMVTRIAQRLGLQEEIVWGRLKELREQVRSQDRRSGVAGGAGSAEESAARSAKPAALERDFLIVLLADPALVKVAAAAICPEQVEHPGLRSLLEGLYRLEAAGETPTLDRLRPDIANPRLAAKALELQDVGRTNPDRSGSLQRIMEEFRRKREIAPKQQELKNQLRAANDHAAAVDLLRRLQNQN